MDGGAWLAIVHGVTKSWTRLSDFTFTFTYPSGSEDEESACNAGDPGSIPGSGRSSGEGNGKPLQDSCQDNLMDGGAWLATVHGVTKSQTQLSNFTHHPAGASPLPLTVGCLSLVGSNILLPMVVQERVVILEF